MKRKTALVLAISFAFILGTMVAGTEGAFAIKNDEKKTEKKEKKEKKVIILYKSDKTDKKDEKGKHKDKEKHVDKLKEKNIKIKHVYDIISGIEATVDEDSIISLMNDEDVLAVVDDVEVHALLNDSIPQINADDVHVTGYTGTGVNVCVVDSGIDDSHSALNPLVNEFDFVNNDSDATDDRDFETTDTVYMLISSNLVDYSNMKKAEWKIQDSLKVKLQGKLILNSDGNYIASVSLADLNAGVGKIELKLEDNNRIKFKVRENITISEPIWFDYL